MYTEVFTYFCTPKKNRSVAVNALLTQKGREDAKQFSHS